MSRRVDWWLLIAIGTIMLMGLLSIISTGVSSTGTLDGLQFVKQLIWYAVGLTLLLAFTWIDYRFLRHLALPVFIAFLLLLALMIFFAESRNATKAWIGIAIFGVDLGIQPSEFAKIALILFFAAFFDTYKERRQSLVFFIFSLAILLLTMSLVVLQGDLGTALVYLPIYFFMASAAGVPWRYLLYTFLLGFLAVIMIILYVWAPYSAGFSWQITRILVVPRLFSILALTLVLLLTLALIAWLFGNLSQFKHVAYLVSTLLLAMLIAKMVDLLLPDYMRKRLLTLIAPELYPLSSGWNVIQSLRAIGSGGIWGNGFMEGILARYGYLPSQSQSTDFLFAVLGEELGFVGCLVVFLGFGTLLARLMIICLSAPDYFSCLITAGMGGLFFFHFLQNVGMNLGLMPVIGIPLPLFSYGGSSVMSSLIGLGIIFNIAAARQR